jgi:hypothetical protein
VEIVAARFYSRGLTINCGIEIARSFNAERLRDGKWDGSWALFCRSLRTRQYGSPFSRQMPRDPASRRSMTVSARNN